MTQKFSKNPTEQRLQGLPFSSASEEKQARHEIRTAVWRRFETARAINEFSLRDEYQFWREEFLRGFICRYGDEDEELVRAFKDGPGIQVNVNKALMNAVPPSENTMPALVKALSEAFANTCYKVNGFLPASFEMPSKENVAA